MGKNADRNSREDRCLYQPLSRQVGLLFKEDKPQHNRGQTPGAARSLSCLEALVGQFYIAVVVARLVSLAPRSLSAK